MHTITDVSFVFVFFNKLFGAVDQERSTTAHKSGSRFPRFMSTRLLLLHWHGSTDISPPKMFPSC